VFGDDNYGGNLYKLSSDEEKATHFTLPGNAEIVSIDYNATNATGSGVTFYNAAGNEIGHVDVPHSEWVDGTKNVSFSAPEGETIASFTTTGIDPIDNISWLTVPETHGLASQDSAFSNIDALIHDSHLDLTGGSANTVHLTLDDVLSHVQDNLMFRDGKGQFAIDGDAGDHVVFDDAHLQAGEFLQLGSVTSGGIEYDAYRLTGADVDLLVQHGVELQHA
jgi:hypothetical protein